MPVTFFVIVVAALLSARIFLMPFIITGGGPGNATRVLSMLIYETGFSYMKMGAARRSPCPVRDRDGLDGDPDEALHPRRGGLRVTRRAAVDEALAWVGLFPSWC